MDLEPVDVAVGVANGMILEPEDGIAPLVPKDLAVLGGAHQGHLGSGVHLPHEGGAAGKG